MADRLGSQKVKVKSFEEIMAEKRQRALHKKEEDKINEGQQKPKVVTLLKSTSQKESSKPTTG